MTAEQELTKWLLIHARDATPWRSHEIPIGMRKPSHAPSRAELIVFGALIAMLCAVSWAMSV